jgi:uncharacterized protein (TIGR02231 family)
MKKIFITTLLLLSIFAKANEIKKEITPKVVTVYLNSAKVLGTTNVTLSKGRNFIKIINLPNDLDPNTYKIGLEKGTILMAITPSNNFLNDKELTLVEKTLETEQKKLRRDIDLLQIQINTLNGEKTIISNNLNIKDYEKHTPQEQLVKLTEFYAKRILEIDNKLYLLNESKTQFNDRIVKITQQMAEERTFKNKNKVELLLEIEADKEISFPLQLSYVVANAGWVPFYDLRAESTRKPFEILYKGKIFQKTGQDWKDVKLFVSTYQPKYNHDRPILSPMYVREFLASQKYYQTDNLKKEKNLMMTNSYQVGFKNNEEEKGYFENPPVELVEGQMNLIYELNYNQTIISQQKEQYVILDKKEVEATYKYHTVPKLNNNVYLLALIKNWESLNLISGEANIYFEDNFVGKTNINSNYTNDEFPISLGIDERIVVKRLKLADKSETKFLNSYRREIQTYEIIIRNSKKEALEIEILDQTPIAENEKITVKNLEIGDGNYNEKTGAILWTRNINAGTTEKITLSYEVKYPKDMKIMYKN